MPASSKAKGRDEDQLAFLRTEPQYRNLTIVELPNGDFARTILRNFLVAAWQRELWQGLANSAMPSLRRSPAKSLKETRYHLQHAADWTCAWVTAPRSRTPACSARSTTSGPTPPSSSVPRPKTEPSTPPRSGRPGRAWKPAWDAVVRPVLEVATLTVPTRTPFLSHGKTGRHTEFMGHLLTEMQYLQRTYPGGTW